jgi:hypothetical protein
VSVAGVAPTRRDTPGAPGVQLAAYASKDFGPVHIDLNGGLNLWRLGDQPAAQPWAALAVTVELPRGFGVMGEFYGFGDGGLAAPRDAGFLSALSYGPRPWVAFDLGTDVGLVRDVRGFSVFAGLTAIPAALW